ncbi:MAG: hypothetical protein ISS79_02405 [Phycisphaerae bacterium]|nr:hypothetical protein [Phycisphaerae bacterium]
MRHSRIKLAIRALIWSFVPLYLCAAGPAAGGTNPQRATVYDLLSRYARVQSDNRNVDANPGDQSDNVQTPGTARVVHFPAEKSLGRLSTQDVGAVRELTYWFHWTGNGEGRPEYLCEAQGDVSVPPGKRLILVVNEVASKNLSGLLKLKPDDLHGLRFVSSLKGPPRLPAGGMKYIAHLTGLKMLALGVRGLTHKDIEQIKALRSLEYFHAPESLTDSGLAQVAELGSLKGLYIVRKSSRVTDAGLKHIGKIKSLEELYLKGERMGDFGLPFLRNLPRLNYLCLYGTNFTDKGMVHVKEMASLRILSFHEDLCRITDAGLVHVSQMPELEILCLHGMRNITDAGMAHLANMRSLRKLNIASSQITDRGLAHLKQIKTLERLELPQDQKGITDAGLAHIAELPNLRSLQISRIHFNDSKMNKEYYTDAGLAELATCRRLEDLSLGSIGITDAGVEHVAKLTNLKSLNLFGCDNITDAGLANLRGLKSLKSLSVTGGEITIAGLNGLKSLSCLERIRVDDFRRGGAVLDLSGMPNLEDLMLYFERESGEAFTDADLACLSGLKRLNNLQIGPRNYTDKGVASLAGLIKMDRLSIGGPALTDEALRHLTRMKNLGLLNISDGIWDKNKRTWGSGGGFTDMALRYIEELKSLNLLEISSEHVFSKAAVQGLRRELPYLYSIRVNTEGAQSP